MNNEIKVFDSVETDADNLLLKISELETSSRKLELDSISKLEISNKTNDYINNFIEQLPSEKAYKVKEIEKLKSIKIGDEGKPFEQLLDILRDEVDQAGINSASGKHFGYIPGGGIWSSAVADMLAAATNRYVGIYYSSPGAVTIENQLIRWLCSIVGYPNEAHGNLTSGGSIANLIDIKTARDVHKINSTNIKKTVIYLTEHTHHCIDKALNILSLDEAIVRKVPINCNFQMDDRALEKIVEGDIQKGLKPFLVIATAGTTDTGAIDPLDLIADICEKNKIWLHIDAAYGGFFILVDELKEKFKGIERSDSIVMDPHKSLFIPYGSGTVLIKNGKQLLSTNSHQAYYMQDAYGFDEINPSDSGPELSRHFRGLRMWIPLHLHGINVFRDNLYEKFLLSRYFYKKIKEMGFETGPSPELSIVCFRFPSKDRELFNKRLIEALRNDGRCFFSSTLIKGEFWIRCAVLSFRSHLSEINTALEMLNENLSIIN